MLKIPTNNLYVEAGKKATQSWDKQTKDLKKIKDAQLVKEELGAPSVWCFNGMLTRWLENSKVEVGGEGEDQNCGQGLEQRNCSGGVTSLQDHQNVWRGLQAVGGG
eukprot:1939858-Karenia_brevis.AAC.1